MNTLKRWFSTALLIAVGAFFIYIPPQLLIEEALPSRYKGASFLGHIFSYIGIVIVLIGIIAIIRNIRLARRK